MHCDLREDMYLTKDLYWEYTNTYSLIIKTGTVGRQTSWFLIVDKIYQGYFKKNIYELIISRLEYNIIIQQTNANLKHMGILLHIHWNC
jgi:hypothetical protein